MSIFQWEQNPWGQDVLVRISWDLLWLAIIGGAAFVIGHFIYRAKNPPKPAEPATGPAADALPEKVVRHSLVARLFHWTMAITMFTLLITAFFPIVGIQFEWLKIHWIAGLVFVGIIVFHIIHATFWMNLRDIWISSKDWAEFKLEMQHALGSGKAPPKPGKYPVDHRLYHNAVMLAGLGVIASGLLMMVRIDTPLFARNPYLLSESTWGWVYVLHGLSAVGLVGLIISHIYFAILPEKRWMTISMIAGWVTKKDFLANHDPERWVVTEKASK
jgi:cytochrome b subunit of formate dehydrogenase